MTLRIAIPVALVAFVSWADHATGSILFVLLAPLTGAFVFLAFFPGWPARAYWPRAALVTAASLWLAVLPWVPWNHVKRFYSDCRRIEAGWSLTRARAAMAPYVLASTSAGTADSEHELDSPHLTFWPDRGRSADWCVVFTEGDRVRGVSIYPD